MNQPVIVTIEKSTGVLTLDRPKALNSLSPEMIAIITEALDQWRDDDGIEQVVIHTEGKHFCSGGDVRWARDNILDGNHEAVDKFMSAEYTMNQKIADFPKPYIALMNGVAMGGGLGVSAHGSHRVITEDSWASMPEMNIGYITDVGMSHMFQHLPGHPSTALGKFLAITGYRLKAGDMMATGLATHQVESFDGLLEAIIKRGPQAIDDAAISPHHAELPKIYADIDEAFVGPWPEIQQRLSGDLKALVADLTAQASPSMMVAAAELFDTNADKSLAEALDNERALGVVSRREPDFVEGVRAVLVDKSNDAQFAPQADPERYREVLS
ncbi:3-hydroxyisobutyryl-CoA hydrolase [Corynebacterium cystitidis]|uniref:3-hydroxyisobutyryl-CoA hydrolase n=1 Tax=Corynebacterium cystitidis TaxID=35757 RepID=UPI00211DB9D3|nr:3-hydroxyisobutyryl-CoA hydrolase [Corynebacterium cystitidis]